MTFQKQIAAYLGHPDFNKTYQAIWGESLHVGIYRPQTLSVEEACQKATDKMLRFVPKLGKSGKLLVLGAGLGGSARYLFAKYGSRIETLHLSETQRQHHQKIVEEMGAEKKMTSAAGPLAPLPYDRESFDLVWAQDTLLHSQKKQRIFREVQRVLKPKGRFVFSEILKSEDSPADEPPLPAGHQPPVEIAAADDYQRLAKRAGLLKVYAVEMPDQVGIHFQKVAENLAGAKLKGEAKFLETTKKSIQAWLAAAEAGKLDWGIFIFQKINN